MKSEVLKTYECQWRGENWSRNVVAKSPAAARYRFYQDAEIDTPYKECFRHIEARSLGKVLPEHFYGNAEDFHRVCAYRCITFARQGMKIDVAGKVGFIVGSNSSCNLDVMFPDSFFPSNCHPTWETTYFREDGEIIKCFKQPTKQLTR